MAPENGRTDGEGNQNIVFIDTSLETRLATIVQYSDTVSDLKKKIAIEHLQSYPAIGDIKVNCLKVKRKGNYYILTDLMLVKSAFVAGQKNWFLSADASRIEQRFDAMQHNPDGDDQLALPWVTDSLSNDNHVDRPSKLSLLHGSPSNHQKIVPFVNQEIPVVDQLTSDDSYKKVSKNVEEDKASTLEPDSDQRLHTKAEEKLFSVGDNDMKSKKRTRDVQNEDTSLKKRRKTQRKEDTVKGSEEDKVLTDGVDMVKDIGTSMNGDNSIEDKSKGKDTALDGVVTEDGAVTEAMDDEHTRTMLVSKKKPKKTKKGKKDAGEKIHPQTNTKASEVDIGNEIPSVSMNGVTAEDEMVVKHADDLVVDISSTVPTPVIDGKNIDAQKNDKTNIISNYETSEVLEKTLVDGSLVNDEQTRTVLVSQKKPKKPRKSKKTAHDQVPTVVPSTVEDVGEKIQSQANTKASEVDIGNDIPSLSTKGVTAEDEMVVKHGNDLVVGISSVEEQKNDKTDGLEKTLVDDTVLYDNDKGDELIVKEGKIPEPSEIQRNQMHEEKETEGKHVDNDAQVLKTSQQNAEISEKLNENTDDTKKKKKKRKSKKSAARNEEEPLTKPADVDLVEKITDAGTDDGDKLESKDAHISDNQNNDKINIISDEQSEVLEKTLGNDSVMYGSGKGDDLTVKEVKIPESTESHKSEMHEETGTEGKHVDNDAEMNENTNDKKKNKNLRKRKRKNEKLAARNEDEPLTKPADVDSHEKIADVELKSKDAHISDELLMKTPKINQKSSKNDLELEPVKSKVPEETLEKVTPSQVPKGNDVNSNVDISKEEGSHEIDFMEYFSPTQQPNTKTTALDNFENVKNPKKKSKQQDDNESLPRNEYNKELLVSKKVPEDKVGVKDQNKMKAPKTTKKIDAKPTKVITPQPSESFGTTFKSQKITKQQPTLGQNHNDMNMKKSGPVTKQLLNTHGAIFGNDDDDDDDDTSANDNVKTINSDSSTRTPSRASPAGESDSSIDSRRYALKRKEGGVRDNMNSQSRSKNLSLTDILKSSSRFKRAKFSASQQLNDTESQPVDFVPESEPVS